MNIEPILYQYNPWWEESHAFTPMIERERLLAKLYPLLDNREVIILTGLRRIGKTTTMKQLIRYLIQKKDVCPYHCFYISMDDYQLQSMSLMELIQAYRQTLKLSSKQSVYVFADEITYIKDFQIQLKNLYDQGVVKCIASSSSSSVLTDDSAYLTGRKRIMEINPLSFEEYLKFTDVQIKPSDQHLLTSYFHDYMQVGGMPEYVLRQEREYLVNLIDDIIMKDIVAYHQLRHPQIVKDMFVLLMERSGKQISVNKIAHILGISLDTVKRYLAMFEQTFLIHLVPRYGKTNDQLLAPKKVYAADIGIRNTITGFRDKGAIFENLVFLAIKHHQPRYVYTQGQEIDFLVNNTLIEVKYNRELEGKQLAAFNEFKASHKLVVSDYDDLNKLQNFLNTDDL